MKVTLQQIARMIDGVVEGPKDAVITGPSKIEEGQPGTLTFLGNPKYESYIYTTKATAVLVEKSFKAKKKVNAALIRVDSVYSALGILLDAFDAGLPEPEGFAASAHIHEKADVSADAKIGEFAVIQSGAVVEAGAIIDAHCFIGAGSYIGKNTRLYPGVRVLHRCHIGANCIVHSNTVIGSDGFGFSTDEQGKFQKIKQTGTVHIEEGVEIGANCTIDRASIGETRIGAGVKLDNLIQVAHNVSIGANTVIAAQAGFAGSTKIGENCMIGGQVGVVGHLELHDRTQIQAQSGIARSTKGPDEKLYGTPAITYGNYLRSYAIFGQLPEYSKKIRKLEQELEDMKRRLEEL
jgi:UDP-3-O-[3-hydroxymyristoyl] glucosamine N-acyltransferase